MPVLNTNTAVQNETVSNGVNKMPAFRSNSFFFLEDGAFTLQTAVQAFGVVSATEFKTTCQVKAAGKKVVSICPGQIFIQPHGTSMDKVNLILKPFTQPIKGLAIKYFIYRGLPKSDFILVDDVAPISGTSTELITHIRTEFTNLYGPVEPTDPPEPIFEAKDIGFPEAGSTQNGNDYIDKYFFKTSESFEIANETSPEFQFECPMIPAGMHIATMTAAIDEIGLDIVLNKGDYYIENDPNLFQLNLDFARAPSFSLDTSVTTDAYLIKLIQEECTHFLDPAAFYGTQAAGGKVKLLPVGSNSPAVNETADDIYALLTQFNTKNKTYFYIQADRQRSYNFYGNYVHSDGANSNDIIAGIDEATATETSFGEQGWPMLVFNNSSTQILRLNTDNSNVVGAYVQFGSLSSRHENGFLTLENLLQEPSTDGSVVQDLNYTKLLEFSFATTTDTTPLTLASFVNVIYKGRKMIVETYIDPIILPAPESEFSYIEGLNDLFFIVDKKSFGIDDCPIISSQNLNLNYFRNSGLNECDYSHKNHLIFDKITDGTDISERCTFETSIQSIRRSIPPGPSQISGELDNISSIRFTFDVNRNNYYIPASPYFLKFIQIESDGNIINCYEFLSDNGEVPIKTVVGISKAEKVMLNTLIDTKNLSNCSLYFVDLIGESSDYYLSDNNVEFKKFQLTILGEDNLGNLKLFKPSEEIILYTKDSLFFGSQEYCEMVPVEFFSDFQDLHKMEI